MPLPFVIGYHLVWTAYGWWLPNDPRGSTSHCIKSDIIARLGELHFGRKRPQPASSAIRQFYHAAEKVLKFSLCPFGEAETELIASAFSRVIRDLYYTCYACAIMPDHIHLLIRKHKHQAEEMIGHFQTSSREAILDARLFQPNHPVWGGPGWMVFLDHPDEIWRTIRYVEDNPVNARLPAQRWSFVTPYDGWPLHAGHNPNSPYARRLRK